MRCRYSVLEISMQVPYTRHFPSRCSRGNSSPCFCVCLFIYVLYIYIYRPYMTVPLEGGTRCQCVCVYSVLVQHVSKCACEMWANVHVQQMWAMCAMWAMWANVHGLQLGANVSNVSNVSKCACAMWANVQQSCSMWANGSILVMGKCYQHTLQM
jgi:hypothetical protein